MTPPPPEIPEAAPAPAPVPSDDSIGKGVLYAILWQIGAIILSAPLMFTVWGLIQWLALVPVYIHLKKRSNRLAAKGLLITGFVGMLLNGACAALVLGNLGNMH
jgi:hypothetical protein